MADTCRHAADGLDRAVGQGDAIGAQCQGLDKIGRSPQSTGYDQGHLAADTLLIEIAPRTSQGGDRRDTDVIAEQQRRGTGPAATSVQDQIIGTGLQGKLDITLDMIGTEFETDRDPAADLAYTVGKAFKIRRLPKIGETGR